MYVRKGNLEYFYKIRIFRPIAFKAIIYPLFDLSFWLFTNSLFKKFRRPEKTFLWGGLIFSDLIFVCVNKKKLTAAISDWFWASTNSFYGHGTLSLSFWLFANSPLKKFGRPEKMSLWGGLIFSDLIYICVNKKKWLQPFLTDFEHVRIFSTG